MAKQQACRPGSKAALIGAVSIISYAHVGYPLLMGLVATRSRHKSSRRAPRVISPQPEHSAVSVVICALNEEEVIELRVRDILAQAYPGPLEIIVVADGSIDQTAHLARAAGARVLESGAAAGKSAAVNRGLSAATAPIVLLTDANCAFAPDAVAAIAGAFDDPRVAVVSGAKTVTGGGARGSGEGLYWRLESVVKQGESAFGTVLGAPGEVCGLRRSATRPIPAGVLNDDYHLTCDALARGCKVVYAPDAKAVEAVSERIADEFERRTRIAAGTWQTTVRHWRLASPRHGVVAFAFVSHRVLRNLVAPLLLPVVLTLSVRCRRTTPAIRALLRGQVICYLMATAGVLTDNRLAAVPFQFLVTNVTQCYGGWRFLTGRQPQVWRRARRSV
jgi:biofilm PGA synthesis N-glycosyltransferase PgaC